MIHLLKLPLQRKSKDISELQLAKLSIEGDSEAFSQLMKLHKVSLYKIAYCYVKDEQKALDILQDTSYKGLLNINKLKDSKFFKTWITKILINISIDYTKKDSNIVYLEEETLFNNSSESTNIEEKLDLYDAIDKLEKS